jgi:hypothetical protein
MMPRSGPKTVPRYALGAAVGFALAVLFLAIGGIKAAIALFWGVRMAPLTPADARAAVSWWLLFTFLGAVLGLAMGHKFTPLCAQPGVART